MIMMMMIRLLLISFIFILNIYTTSSLLPDSRPCYDDRTFTSKTINSIIAELSELFKDDDIARMFNNCWPNTLDTTISSVNFQNMNDLDSFVITGDIDALWLRDSQNQLQAYLPYATNDTNLTNLIEGLIQRQAKSILIDSFANSFNYNASGNGHQTDKRKPPMSASVFEGKYELDSLMSFLKLSFWHYRYSGVNALKRFGNEIWLKAVSVTLETVNVMQKDNGQQDDPPYLFERLATNALDTLIMNGRGPPTKPTTGLSRQLFRPSDDAVSLGYNIPGNVMACVELKHTSELLAEIGESKLKSLADDISFAICNGIDEIFKKSIKSNTSIPYEVDGYGGEYFMDDANVPSLLSIPLLGYMSNDHDIYKKTRQSVFSKNNPYFYEGKDGYGIGGPHEGVNYAWPMSLIVAAMTSNDDDEIVNLLNILKSTTADTGFMHEAFNVNNSSDYTRSWFAWTNGLFGELILQLIITKPTLVLKNDPDIISKAQSIVKIPVSLQSQLDSKINS